MAMVKRKYLFVLFITCCLFQLYSSEPVSLVVGTAVGIGVTSVVSRFAYNNIWCHYKECCTERWTTPDYANQPDKKSLQTLLENRVHGQHLAVQTVYKVVEGHLKNPSPSKALVLSLHGWTGSGKNFISKLVAEHLYRKGHNSKYVHLIIATHDFPHKDEIGKYKEDLKSWIKGNVSKCERSLFIFDEMDKMPEGLLDVLKPFLDHYNDVTGTDYRKSIFILLSNTGGNIINEETLRMWKLGKRRDEITIKRMDALLHLDTFNTDGGLWHSTLIEKHLIDYFIPFLPMERYHIKLCAKDDMEAKGHKVTEQNLNRVADEIDYFPKDLKVFSKSGCKKVSSKVDLIMG